MRASSEDSRAGRHPAAIGIDVGGTGIKGAAVDPVRGALLSSRHRVPTPPGGSPKDISRAVGALASAIRSELGERRPDLDTRGLPVGVTLPGVIRSGTMLTAANIDAGWIGTDARELLSAAVEAPCRVMNDADAAGVAECAVGAAAGATGVTMLVTFGTGIGSALLHDGVLVPNFELGHLELDGHAPYERYASPKNISPTGIDLAEWARRAGRYLQHLERLCRPDMLVLGGSISRAADDYLPFAGVDAPVVPARLRNNAGLVGAAMLATQRPAGSTPG